MRRFRIVGLTDQLVHQHIAQEKYLEYVLEIQTEVRAHLANALPASISPRMEQSLASCMMACCVALKLMTTLHAAMTAGGKQWG